MDIYKEAAKRKLRFETERGELSVESLWSLKMATLANLIKKAWEEKKKLEEKSGGAEELSFLSDTKEDSEALKLVSLKFDILSDIYKEKKEESIRIQNQLKTKEEVNKIAEALASKKEKALSEMTEEELLKRLDELTKES
jgi:hypothetical protein